MPFSSRLTQSVQTESILLRPVGRIVGGGGGGTTYILLESGDALLLETGDHILQE